MNQSEIERLRRSIVQVRESVRGVQDVYGDAPQVRRLLNDLERLQIDAEELAAARPSQPRAADQPAVPVPDTPYDDALWVGADDEGIGGYHGDRS